MPTYDYKCRKCRRRFSRFQSISAAPLKTCPSCKTGRVDRLIGTGGGLIFKGSGFYITDYKKSGGGSSKKGNKDKGEGKETSGGAKGDSGKTDNT